MKKRSERDLFQCEHGTSLVEMAVLLPLFAVLLFVAVDFGRACYIAIEVAGAARAGAMYGSQDVTDTTGIENAARDAAPDVAANLSVNAPTCSVECLDGTNYAAGCSTAPPCATGVSYVYIVSLTVTGTYSPLVPWPGIPSSLSFSSSASMRGKG
jgi:Flp pilus assembly protein TadG